MGLEKFSAALDLLVGFHVNLYVGEEIFKGKLIGVETDHVVLETENKYIFYYNIDKIQAITKNTKQFQPEGATVEFQRTQSLMELLHSFHYSWVTILSINKQRFYGVLSEIDEDFVTLINGEERILIKVTHISNILKGFIKEKPKKKEQQKSDSKNETNNQKNESKDNDKSNDSDNNKDKNKDNDKDKDKDKDKNNDKDKDNVKDKDKNKANSKDNDSDKDKNKAKDNVKCKDNDEIHCQEPKEYTAETYTGEKTIKFHSNCDTCDKEQELGTIEVSEKNTPMVWSQPIKVESSKQESKEVDLSKDKKLKNETESTQITKKEIKQTMNEMDHKKKEESDSPQVSKKETKKTINETSQKEKKSEESKTTETKSNKENKSSKETKSSKDTKTNKDTKQTSTNPTSKKEKKQEKPQENTNTSNLVLSKTAASKNTETAQSEKFNNDTQKVWKQKDKETRTARFTGEPVPRNQERNFPFAGWPRSNKRTFRF